MNGLRIVGGAPLRGRVRVGGSKNSALAILAGALLVEDELVIHNFPLISDAQLMVELLNHLGVKTRLDGTSLYLDPRRLTHSEPPESIVRKMRASFYVMGPILARLGHARIPMPGGCQIGTRPVNFHIDGFKTLGAEVSQGHGAFEARSNQLIGGEIYLDFPSAGATQHLMTAACLAEGVTTLQNAAMEPEVTELAFFLNRMGARIEGAGTKTITIQGMKRLHGGEFKVTADRIQAGTFLLMGAATHGDVTVEDVCPEHLHPLTLKLRGCGVTVEEGHDYLRVTNPGRHSATDITTMPHPGFPTDMQQPMCVFLALAQGVSTVTETIYESRSKHVSELQRMGADIKSTDGRTILINGVERLTGARVEGYDLRGGAAMVTAALAAEGESLVTGVEYIDRGYENFEANISSLGGTIERVMIKEELPVGSVSP